MSEILQVDILRSWDETVNLKTDWNRLHKASERGYPFTSFEWFECWYRAFCEKGKERIILVKERNNLRAIFPGMLVTINVKGIPLNSFSFAANGHSNYAGIISRSNDYEAIAAGLSAPFSQLGDKIDIVSLQCINEGSPTNAVLENNNISDTYIYTEHSYESSVYSLKGGWEKYLKSRPKSFGSRLRNSINRGKRLGMVKYEIISGKKDSTGTIKRLKILDSKTWQHKNKTGLFSNIPNETFYTNLISILGENINIILCIVKIDGRDVAYQLAAKSGSKAYYLKTGYDKEYKICRPGVLAQCYLSEYLATMGVDEIDLMGEVTDEKKYWETHRYNNYNYWLIKRDNIKGKILLLLLGIKDRVKELQR